MHTGECIEVHKELPYLANIARRCKNIFVKHANNMTTSKLNWHLDGESFLEVNNIGELNNIVRTAIQKAKQCKPTYTAKSKTSFKREAIRLRNNTGGIQCIPSLARNSRRNTHDKQRAQ